MNVSSTCLNCEKFYVTYYPDSCMKECCDEKGEGIKNMNCCPKIGKDPNTLGQAKLTEFGIS